MKIRFFTFILLFAVQHIFAQIEGTWKGDLSVQGIKLPLVIEIESVENGYKSTLYSPKQSSQGFPTTKITFENSELYFENELLQAQYKGTLKDGKITGTFTQGGVNLPLILEKNEKTAALPHTVPNIGNREINTEKLTRYIDYFVKKHHGIGSVSISRNGKQIYQKSFGQSQLPHQNYNENTGYQIGSITKLFLATMIMQDVENGKLNLSDKLSKFYPHLPNADKITLKNMLNHTSGLGDYVGKTGKWLMNEPVSEKMVLDSIAKQGVLFEPNENTNYSNSAYYLLCKILEKSHKKPFNVLLKERITKKLGLKNTFSVLDYPKNIFASYQFVDGKHVLVKDFNFVNALGAGDITSTTDELNVFIQALFSGKLLKKETVQMMLPVDTVYGLCVRKVPFYNQTYYGHGGTTLGTDALMAYNPIDDIAISVCVNGRGLYSSNEFNIGILNIIYDEPFEFEKE